jgi:ATP-dependent DNA ligase
VGRRGVGDPHRGREAVWCGKDGLPSFEELHSRAYDDQVFLYAFDLLKLDGVITLSCRLKRERRDLRARTKGMRFGLPGLEGSYCSVVDHVEGDVSKRRDLPYRSGPQRRG